MELTMATNKIFDDIFSTDHSERAVAFKNNIKTAIASFNANPSNIAHIRYLNSQYWDMVFFIVKKRLLSTGELHFSDSEKLAIDFGYISDELLGENNAITPESLSESVAAAAESGCPVKCFSISSWLYEQLQDFMGVNKLKEYEKKYEALVATVNNLRDEKLVVIESKKKLDKSFSEHPPKNIARADVDKLLAYNVKVDEALEKYGALRSRIQNELLLKKDERVEFVNLENQINKTREERKRFCKSRPGLNQDYIANLYFLEDMIIQKEHEIFDNVTLIGKSRQKIEEFIYSKKEILDEEKDDFLKERISAIKNIIEVISRSNKIEPVIFLTQGIVKNIPQQMFQLIEGTMELDPDFFDNKKVKMYGYPDIILVPGKGKGDYDYHLNAFIVPQFPTKDFTDSFLNAMAIYRWECDDENKLKNSYSFLKSNKYFTNTTTLMQSFIKNYCLYISKSLSGEETAILSDFDYETRGWFIGYISQKEVQQTPGLSGAEETFEIEEDGTGLESPDAGAEKDVIAAQPSDTPAAEKIPQPKTLPKEKGLKVEIISAELKSGKKSQLKLPGEFAPDETQGESPGEEAAPQVSQALNDYKKSVKLPGEFNGSPAEKPFIKESPAAREVSETISLLLKENSAIIKKRIKSVFKLDDVTVEPSKDHQKVNITISNLDANQVKHFLNLMSLQSKYYKFMSSLLKEEEIS